MSRPTGPCGSGKVQHANAEDARRSMNRRQRNYKGRGVLPGGKIKAYRCPECGWWHLGHERNGRKP